MDTTPTDALISQLDRLAGEFAAAIAPLEDEQAMRATLVKGDRIFLGHCPAGQQARPAERRHDPARLASAKASRPP